jgi:hypothetical protein
MEYLARTQPVENPPPTDVASLDDRIDQRITHILGKTVVPMFNALIETSGEHRRELIALRTGVQRIERRLQQHHARLQRLEGRPGDRPFVGVMASMDAMNGGAVRLGRGPLRGDLPLHNRSPDHAAQAGITAVHRGLLEEWSAGATLKALE